MRAEHALRTLEEWRFRVGRIREVNDPYDSLPKVVTDAGATASAAEASARLQRWNVNVGILSFSGQIVDPVIWSHYADFHRGIALGFDYVASKHHMPLFEVSYAKERPVVSLDELQYDAERMDEVFGRIFATKAESWAYEQEFRMYVFLSGCETSGGSYFYPIPENLLLRHVVLGVRCTVERQYVQHALASRKKLHGALDIGTAELSTDEFTILVLTSGNDKAGV